MFDQATCIGCGCTDTHACWDDETGEPCHWLRVDYPAGLGVCSVCHDFAEDWDDGDREVHVPVEIDMVSQVGSQVNGEEAGVSMVPTTTGQGKSTFMAEVMLALVSTKH